MSDPKKPGGTPKDKHYANLRRAFRDQKAGGKPGGGKSGGAPAFRPRPPVAPGDAAPDGLVRLYGIHTVRAAIDNPRRKIVRMLVTRNAAERLELGDLSALPFPAELVEPRDIDKLTGSEAVHQGVVIEAKPLTPKPLDALGDTKLVVVLDQVTDPHNVGAILRSAAAFGAAGVIVTDRHAPADTGVLAKAASGALEVVPLMRAINLARTLDQLKDAGFWRYGLDERGDARINDLDLRGRTCIVLGAEGEGLRRLTSEKCDRLTTIPTSAALAALNVSNAAAVAAYEWARQRPAV